VLIKNWGEILTKKIYFDILIFTITLLCSLNLYGQEALGKGTWSVGGQIQASTLTQDQDYDYFTQKNVIISPQFSYFLSAHFSIGGALSYNYFYSKDAYKGSFGGSDVNKTANIGFGPSLRYYLDSALFTPFIESSINYSIPVIAEGLDNYVYSYELKAGIDLFIGKSAAIEFSLGLSRIMYTSGKNDSKNFSNMGIGFNYFVL
jgi:hypothetical protein